MKPEIQIVESIVDEKNIQKESFRTQGKVRNNNRKATKDRKIQSIIYIDASIFPPMFKQKFIKHR